MARPLKRAEYEVFHLTRQAEKGWRDLLATHRNAVVDAWQHLTTRPASEDGQSVYRLKGDLATGTHDAKTHPRYQYKLPDGARIWYFIDIFSASEAKTAKAAGRVLIENVHTAHPNETK